MRNLPIDHPDRRERPETTDKSSTPLVTIALLILAGIWLRITLCDYSFWFDEYASLSFARLPLHQLWSDWMTRETNPPLFYSLLQFWSAMGADTVFSLRLLPIVGGSLELILIATLSYLFFGARSAVFAVLIAGLSAEHIFYSHLLRAYIFEADAVLVSLIGLLIVSTTGWKFNKLGWGLYVGGAVAAIFFHTTMLLWPVIATLGSIARIALSTNKDWQFLKKIVVANLAIVIGSAWWIYITVDQMLNGSKNVEWIGLTTPGSFFSTALHGSMLIFDRHWLNPLFPGVVLLATIASQIITWPDKTARFVSILAALSLLVFCLIGMAQPIILERTLFWISIFPILLISTALGTMRSSLVRWGGISSLVLLLTSNLLAQKDHFEIENWSRPVRTIAEDPRGVLLVRGLGRQKAVTEACRLELRLPQCPFKMIEVATNQNPSKPASNIVPPNAVADHLSPNEMVYAMEDGPAGDPFKLFKISTATAMGDGSARLFWGPVAASDIIQARKNAASISTAR